MDNILIVEDEQSIREPIMETLSLCNYSVLAAENGIQAIEQARSHKIDLILCDIMMPEMNGIETLKYFQEDEVLKTIPFVFLSALSERSDIRKGMINGAEDYLTKPFSTKELLKVIEVQLKKSKFRRPHIPNVNRAIEQSTKDQNTIKALEAYMKSAGHVQNAILPTNKEIKQSFPSSFVMFKPKYDVSGDFYWIKDFGRKKLISVIDCTGHGISASLLSMCYYSALNQAVDLKKHTDPKEILKWTIDNVSDYLTDHNSHKHDMGMDAIMVEVDVEEKKLKYVSARRPLYFLTKQKIDTSGLDFKKVKKHGDSTLYRFKGGNRYFSLKSEDYPLAEHEISYTKGDCIYLNSDGFEDQFGGDDNKRFKSKNFMSLLESVQSEKLKDQKAILESSFENWKEGYDQIDDVTVIGLKL